jgi:uncharacterized Ntn-hydrolase superfamily protein
MKRILLIVILSRPLISLGQHTFSIVAVDSITGEIGSAGATCGDSIRWPGTPGAKLISDIIPGKGAIHTQSYYHQTNQNNARTRMLAGDTPKEIINWLVVNDVQGDPSIRQYGIVTLNGGRPMSAAYTGTSAMDYKNHLLGPNYAIQGNILLGPQILDSMEKRFLRTKGFLADKLMAAMQGANIVGADARCQVENTSSLSAFIRVAKMYDLPGGFYMDLNVAATAPGVEPIGELQKKFDNWKLKADIKEPMTPKPEQMIVFPNPAEGFVTLQFSGIVPDKIELTNIFGVTIQSFDLSGKVGSGNSVQIELPEMADGLYFMNAYRNNSFQGAKRIIVSR